MHTRHIVVFLLARLCSIFPRYLIKGKIFEKKIIEFEMSVLIFSTILSELFLALRIMQQEIITNVCWSSFKVPVIIVGF